MVHVRNVDAERAAIVAILAPQLGVLHHKASGYELNFVLFSGIGATADMARQYTAEALCDLFEDIGIRLVISDDIDLEAIGREIAEQKAAQDNPTDPNAPRMQRPTHREMQPGETLADVAPALIHDPKRDLGDKTPLGRVMQPTDRQKLQFNKGALDAMNPRAKAFHFVQRMVKPLLEKQGCSVLSVDNGQDGMQEPTKVTLHIDLPSETLSKGTRR